MTDTSKASDAFPDLPPAEIDLSDKKLHPWEEMGSGTLAEREQSALRGMRSSLAVERAPQEPSFFEKCGIHFTAASAAADRLGVDNRKEASDPIARLTVYAMNASVMVFVFPLGVALLLLNVLAGENLRTTAHVMALAGLGMALNMTETGARIFGAG
ncbi:MAG: hypothetical protein KJN93_04650 [Alphaproteobacteria bacterium]|nr:hypothetical protein [Alphaproteobacteria bacterium]NNF25093.1 hypothetical protein [Paracoccaceae bacterium]